MTQDFFFMAPEELDLLCILILLTAQMSKHFDIFFKQGYRVKLIFMDFTDTLSTTVIYLKSHCFRQSKLYIDEASLFY